MSEKRLRASLANWKGKVRYRQGKAERHAAKGNKRRAASRWHRLAVEAREMVRRRTRQLDRLSDLRERALTEARKDVGLMEHGGNNRGKRLERLVHYIGGAVGAPWCGYAVAAWYRRAGSKYAGSVWGYVYAIAGRGTHKTASPQPGDIVVYNFGHTGLFVRWLKNGNFLAVEGNTGASGAVSDSTTGGDGVYEKERNRRQVLHFLRVER